MLSVIPSVSSRASPIKFMLSLTSLPDIGGAEVSHYKGSESLFSLLKCDNLVGLISRVGLLVLHGRLNDEIASLSYNESLSSA